MEVGIVYRQPDYEENPILNFSLERIKPDKFRTQIRAIRILTSFGSSHFGIYDVEVFVNA